jgi:uridine phosphorylase
MAHDVTAERKYHVGLTASELGAYVLVPGDPFRTALIARHLEDAEEKAWSREFRTFTGRVGDAVVSTCSSGIGGPSMAIALEELGDLGAHTFLRVGTCGGAQPGIRLGDLVIATGAVRSEGTPDAYVPREYPAIASHDVVTACAEAAAAAGIAHHLGVIRSVDALYADLAPERLPRGAELRAELDLWAAAGVVANDMESATLMVVSSLRGWRAGVILLCVDELGAGEIHHVEPAAMDALLGVAVDAVRRLVARDRAAPRQ